MCRKHVLKRREVKSEISVPRGGSEETLINGKCKKLILFFKIFLMFIFEREREREEE